jgi:cytosine/adenosine deaminase-related metal-dependent hydrolase
MQIVAASYLLPMQGPVITGGAMAFDNGQIIALGTRAEMTALFAAPVTDYPGCVIMPGLVNAHTHLALTHFPAWKLRKGLDYLPRTYVDWVIQVIKIARGLTIEEKVLSLQEGIEKSLEAGTTAIGEIVTDFSLIGNYATTPMRGRLLLEVIGQDQLRGASQVENLLQLIAQFPVGRFAPGISPHTPHTVADQILTSLSTAAEKLQIPLVVHLAESAEELLFAHDSTGTIASLLYPFVGWEQYIPHSRHTTPTAHLATLGLLKPGTVAVHGVHLTPSDAELLRQHGVGVILCPRSNERLNVGKAPIHLYKKLGIKLALGTDSLASNDSLSLWDELRALQDLFPGAFTPEEALTLATFAGAELLGIAHEAGSLKAGKSADFLVVQPTEQIDSPTDIARSLIDDSRILQTYIAGTPC